MKESNAFRLRPVRRYSRVQYPSESGENLLGRACWLAWLFPKKLVKGAVAVLLLGGLLCGAAGCSSEDSPGDGDYPPDSDGVPSGYDEYPPDGEGVPPGDIDFEPYGDGDAEDGDVSIPAVFTCLSSDAARVFQNETSEIIDCTDWCLDREEYRARGSEWVSLAWCDPKADEPCQCEYDYPPGVRHDCVPKTAACDGIDGIRYCSAAETWHDLNCQEVCLAFYGPKFTPCLCREDDPENICGCAVEHSEDCTSEFGASCRIEGRQYTCADSWNALGCRDYQVQPIPCEEICADTPEANRVLFSYCDPQANGGSCHCETYENVTGLSCMKEDLSCLDEQTLGICTALHAWHRVSCDEYCTYTHGWEAVSTGCSETDPENICGCVVESGTPSRKTETRNPRKP